MLNLKSQTERHVLDAAAEYGKGVDDFLEMLIELYQDQQDVKDAKEELKELGGICLPDLRVKYGL
jgi:hypothetical protein